MVVSAEFRVVLVKNATLLAMNASAAKDQPIPIMNQVSNMAIHEPKVTNEVTADMAVPSSDDNQLSRCEQLSRNDLFGIPLLTLPLK